jgi:adenosylmethionine-8-amino-7-oxononanoate aminotransferase
VLGLKAGSGSFQHGQTYQCHPLNAVAALEVQRIIKEGNLVKNARNVGAYFGQLLQERFANHPNVGDVRGRFIVMPTSNFATSALLIFLCRSWPLLVC